MQAFVRTLVVLGVLVGMFCAWGEADQAAAAKRQPARDAGTPGKTQQDDVGLLDAAWNGRTETVSALLDRGVNVNAQDPGLRTALMAAAGNGHAETVQALLARGADVHAGDEYGGTALMNAVVNGY